MEVVGRDGGDKRVDERWVEGMVDTRASLSVMWLVCFDSVLG